MDASWQPDPTGRHQYRWWDGAGWTESVADDGRTSTDPVGPSASTSASPPTVVGATAGSPFGAPAGSPLGAPGPVPAAHSLPDYSTPTVKKSGGAGKWIAIAVVAVLALGVVGFLV